MTGTDGPTIRVDVGPVLEEMVRRSHLTEPSRFPDAVAEVAGLMGAREVVLYCLDYEQTHLLPVPATRSGERHVLSVDGSLAGRAFTTCSVVEGPSADADDSGRRLWVPLLDGTERLGVLELTFTAAPTRGEPPSVDPDLRTASARFAGLVAELLNAKSRYGDVFESLRRRQRPSVAAEVQWNLLPPLTVATDSLVVSAVLEPAYDVAGDSFDYAVNGDIAHLAIFDAMGHGLASALFASVAVAAYRNSRRAGVGLTETYRFLDDVLVEHGGGAQFTTAILAELDVRSGLLRWISAGHLPPLLLRHGGPVVVPEVEPATPLGLGLSPGEPAVGSVQLEPADRVLLYTDGVVEARTPEGDFFGVDRLVDLLVRGASSGHHAPEALRRLGRAVLAHQQGVPVDDVTTVLVEWRGDSQHELLPA